jgi:phosphopantothenoylcysteine decarboxylase/phosphopantothenate--cysteine ligase
VVGFAAETQNVERNALAKLEGKRLDMIAANQVGDGLAFDCDDNALTLYWPGGKRELERAGKARLAGQLIGVIAERFASSGERGAPVSVTATASPKAGSAVAG